MSEVASRCNRFCGDQRAAAGETDAPARAGAARRRRSHAPVPEWAALGDVLDPGTVDTLLTACVLLALLGLVQVWRGGALRGWMAYGAGVGLGLLSKGPVVLIHVLPAAVLAPWWTRNSLERRWGSWYLGLVVALALGAGLGLAWALTASADQGGAYRDAILWGQTAGRITKSLPIATPCGGTSRLFRSYSSPGASGPQWWRSLAGAVRAPTNVTVRFGLAWVTPGFVILSLIREAAALSVSAAAGVALLAAKALPSDRRQTAIALSLVSPLLVILVETAGKGYLDRSDLRPVSSYLHQAEASGRPIAFKGQYAGTFHFLGRLEHPFAQLSWEQVPQWAREHPTGLLIRSTRSPADTVGAVFTSRIAAAQSAYGELRRCHPRSVALSVARGPKLL